jgi:hypothetical protein
MTDLYEPNAEHDSPIVCGPNKLDRPVACCRSRVDIRSCEDMASGLLDSPACW